MLCDMDLCYVIYYGPMLCCVIFICSTWHIMNLCYVVLWNGYYERKDCI